MSRPIVDHRPNETKVWIGLMKSPEIDEIDEIIEKLLNIQGRYVVHAEHIETESLIPSVSVVYHVLKCILKYKTAIRTKLICTVIQTKRQDPLFDAMKNFALSLYQPEKPFCITHDKEEIDDFVRDQLEKDKKKIREDGLVLRSET